MLFFVQPLSENSVINCRALWPLHSYRFLINILSSLMNGIKVAAFAWYSVKIRVIFGVRFERRKAHKSKPTVKLKHGNSIVESFEYLCQISSNRILSFTVSKLVHFWDKVLSLLLLRSVLSLPSRLCPLLIFFPPFLPRTPLPHSYIQLGGLISAVSSLVLQKQFWCIWSSWNHILGLWSSTFSSRITYANGTRTVKTQLLFLELATCILGQRRCEFLFIFLCAILIVVRTCIGLVLYYTVSQKSKQNYFVITTPNYQYCSHLHHQFDRMHHMI